MRVIEKQMIDALASGREFHKDNTHVYKFLGSWYVSLHGNVIARFDPDGSTWYSCAGWYTATTRSRLQALGAPCRIKDYTMIDTRTGNPFPSTLERF